MIDQGSPEEIGENQASARGKDRKSDCRDCMFWYRCRLGQIDCDRKA